MPSNDTAVSFREFRENLSSYLKRAQQGDTFAITSRGTVVARLGPPAPDQRRPVGLLKGKIWMAPDFDETPPDLIDAMEGREPDEP